MHVAFYFTKMIDEVLSNTADINTTEKGLAKEGVIGGLIPELLVDTPDSELLDRAKKIQTEWETFVSPYLKKGKINRRYWEGKQWTTGEVANEGVEGARPYVDNLIFESLETFLPLATRANPEPSVKGGTDEEKTLVQDKLKDLSDDNRLKLILKSATRNWALDWLGVVECYLDPETGEPCAKAIDLSKVILDKESTIENGKYTGDIVGLFESTTAREAIEKFSALQPPQELDELGQPIQKEQSVEEFLTAEVKQKLGTKIQYIKWLTKDMVFYTYKKRVLAKFKNPYWNEDTPQQTVDEFGNPIEQIIPAKNHFKSPKIPVEFLSVFNTGDRPIDTTNLIWQVIPQQDQINKRGRQLDRNNDGINGGWAISGQKSGLTQEQATQAVEVLHDGGGLYIPNGNPNEAIAKLVGQPLPPEVYRSQQDARVELRGVFGTSASTPQGIQSQDTARGKILAKGTDDSRIGGGVSEYIEQLADGIYNQWLQMLYVFDPEIQAIQSELKVSVKEGSMIPKDSLTRRNEAIDLFTAGVLAPIDLYRRLEDPNPEQTAANLAAYQAGQAMGAPMQAAQGAQPQPTPDQQLLNSVPV